MSWPAKDALPDHPQNLLKADSTGSLSATRLRSARRRSCVGTLQKDCGNVRVDEAQAERDRQSFSRSVALQHRGRHQPRAKV